MTMVPPVPQTTTGTSRRNLLRSFRSAAGGAVVGYAVNLALVPFVLHHVGSEIYGAWATMASILAVGALADAGVRTEIIRRVGSAQGEGDKDTVVATVRQGVTLLVVLAGLITLVGLLVAPLIRAFAFPNWGAGLQRKRGRPARPGDHRCSGRLAGRQRLLRRPSRCPAGGRGDDRHDGRRPRLGGGHGDGRFAGMGAVGPLPGEPGWARGDSHLELDRHPPPGSRRFACG